MFFICFQLTPLRRFVVRLYTLLILKVTPTAKNIRRYSRMMVIKPASCVGKQKITDYGVSPIGRPNWAAWLLKVCLSSTGFPGVWPSATGTSNSTPETWHGPSSSQK